MCYYALICGYISLFIFLAIFFLIIITVLWEYFHDPVQQVWELTKVCLFYTIYIKRERHFRCPDDFENDSSDFDET